MNEIFFYTNAGGTADLFKLLCNSLADKFTCFPYEYPGHGKRRGEGLCDNFDKLTDYIFLEFCKCHDANKRYILFGYSMGTLAVMELLRKIEKKNMILPYHVILAADAPCWTVKEDSNKTEEENINDFYIKNGSIRQKTMSSKLFQAMYMSSFRNDYFLMRNYDYNRIAFRSSVPCTVIYSESDTPFCLVKLWDFYFISEPIYMELQGDHFFINANVDEIADIVKNV